MVSRWLQWLAFGGWVEFRLLLALVGCWWWWWELLVVGMMDRGREE